MPTGDINERPVPPPSQQSRQDASHRIRQLQQTALRSDQQIRARADTKAADLAPIIKELQAAGKTSLRAIAAGLNEAGKSTLHQADHLFL